MKVSKSTGRKVARLFGALRDALPRTTATRILALPEGERRSAVEREARGFAPSPFQECTIATFEDGSCVAVSEDGVFPVGGGE